MQNAAKFGDGYLVRIKSYGEIPIDKIAKVDHEGNITGYFSFGSEDSLYFINDMTSFNGKIYLSGFYVERIPDSGNPREFYSVKGSFGSELSVSRSGELLWNVESIVNAWCSPFTSAFSFVFDCLVYKYGFDASGTLVGCEKTDEKVTAC